MLDLDGPTSALRYPIEQAPARPPSLSLSSVPLSFLSLASARARSASRRLQRARWHQRAATAPLRLL